MFNEVKDESVRVWNRCSTAFNLGAKSLPLMREYLGQFTVKDRMQISNMFKRVKERGYENTKKEVMKTLVREDDYDGI